MLSAPGQSGRRIRRRTSPASTREPWTMTFTFSPLRLSAVSLESDAYTHLQCGLARSLSCSLALDVIPNPTGRDHTLRTLISLSLSVCVSPAVSFSSDPLSLSPRPPCTLPVISADLYNRHRHRPPQCNVAYF